ncbi:MULTISPECIES: hypothetical protein [unclassified Gordonia (in: high G+C Gram-positive bacteria)]|uniref:hypothetical protein n=1 Tax=unclassified Gordonia (in: high G+C Gram-positive bacteria) TaxID=2657482 RepID=UPI001965124F|nr:MULTISPECIES: hypothetical protein [unclassified Gordonia (in: high G+C Gram-positive bacteria)]MBN0973498.1 hypothetical protein [Gordonia sp. BP-119]MBN0982114.1 hypothetical protein [Gordonia sp. BP-94]
MDMNELLADIDYRGYMTPTLVAVRLAGHPVTYGVLAERLAEIGDQTDSSASLYMALMSLLPYDLRTASPAEDLRIVGYAIGWLGRHVAAEVEAVDHQRPALRAVS